ncbi:MAG: hypothetical protein H6842_15765 [Rhodospirillaceae bacterium]|nr:hypothetical protein [Rhodospirillaceae bacterium]
MTWRHALAAPAVCLLLFGYGAGAQSDWIGIPLSGSAMLETFAQNYILGVDDDGRQFVLDFSVDGDVVIRLQDGRSLSGRWRMTDHTACITWADTTAEACHDVYLAGDAVNFTTADQQVLRTTRLRHDPPPWLAP